MCGIYAAPTWLNGFGLAGNHVSGMLDAMNYRGPDEQRMRSAAGFTVGFARLAIVDTKTEAAVQPAVTKKSRIVAFNGEFYNYHSLDPDALSEVELLGRMIDDRCDPRQFIDGDYAIIVYDPTHWLITLYRDRFGTCPLYYQTRPYLAVSSEARRLKHPVSVEPHEKVVLQFMGRKGEVLEKTRWPHYGVTVAQTSYYAVETFRHLFAQAVASRALHTDSGFSIAASGGLDSSAVILMTKQLGLRPQMLLCVTADEHTEDAQNALHLAQALRWPLNMIVADESKIEQEKVLIKQHMDYVCRMKVQPVNWRVAVRNWFVAKHSPTRVVLSGEGSDELFNGYPPHPERLRIPYRIAKKQVSALNSLPHCSLELSNKIGLAHSVEFRSPYLHSTLSYWLLASQTGTRKELLRSLLHELGAPVPLLQREKWGSNEKLLDATWKKEPA